MNNSKQVYLLPCKISTNSRLSPISHLQSQDPILIYGFSIYSIISRLDMIGFSFYCIPYKNADKSCMMYPYTFDENPDFSSLGFNEEIDSKSRIILHISKQFLNELDKNEGVYCLKNGNWNEERNKLEEIAALKHLGIIKNLSSKTFKLDVMLNGNVSKFQKIYNVDGGLNESLMKIFKRLELAVKVFGIDKINEKITKIKKERNFCFGSLVKCLEKSQVVDMLYNYIPISLNENRCVFNIVLNSLNFIHNFLIGNKFNTLKADGPSDFKAFMNALNTFQKVNNLEKTTICDKKTIIFIVKNSKTDIIEPLPIFKMIGINYDINNDYNLSTMKNIDYKDNDTLVKHVTDEINRGIAFLPEPKIKVKSMVDKVDEFTIESELKCKNLSSNLSKIEDNVTKMTGMLKEVFVDSESAISRVSSASETLKSTYQYHREIQEKFNILGSQLSEEERKTRVTLLIGIIISFLSAIRFFMI